MLHHGKKARLRPLRPPEPTRPAALGLNMAWQCTRATCEMQQSPNPLETCQLKSEEGWLITKSGRISAIEESRWGLRRKADISTVRVPGEEAALGDSCFLCPGLRGQMPSSSLCSGGWASSRGDPTL